jgi:hypothetical protein
MNSIGNAAEHKEIFYKQQITYVNKNLDLYQLRLLYQNNKEQNYINND